MAAYTNAANIAAYLGITLTSPQQTQAGICAQAASDWIDRHLGRSWQGSSPVTDEPHSILGDRVYLDQRPVTSITAVKTRQPFANGSESTLDASQYELLDADAGIVLISGWTSDSLALVSYTHAASVLSTVALAATIIAASWLAPTLAPQSAGLESVAVGQNDVNVKFRKDRGDVPAEALRLLGSPPVVIA